MNTPYNLKWLTEKFKSGETLKYIFFWGHSSKLNEPIGKFCFSQWFESPFIVDDITYKTAEHWMMAQKALLFDDQKAFQKIVSSNKPGEVKEHGRNVLNFDFNTWDRKKYEIVKLGNIHKFNQHPELAEFLLKTENRILVEASPVDLIWGIGIAADHEDKENPYSWRGQNLLGFALMEARDFLHSFGHFQPLANEVPPIWKTFPNVEPHDMFWRMGKGEEAFTNFNQYYERLNDRNRIIYKLTNPAPYGWENFYS